MRISRCAASLALASVLAVSAAAPAVAAEDLQPLPPIRSATSAEMFGSLGLGSSNACTELKAQLDDVKVEWDAAVAATDYDLANLLRLDYTNLAVSYYQCNLAKGSLL